MLGRLRVGEAVREAIRAGVGLERKKDEPTARSIAASTSARIDSVIRLRRRMRAERRSIVSRLSRIGCSRGMSESAPKIVPKKPGGSASSLPPKRTLFMPGLGSI